MTGLIIGSEPRKQPILPYSHHKFYLSGPMSGLPNYNYEKFDEVTWLLRNDGYTILSPHENPAPEEALDEHATWEYYMKLCKKQVLDSTAIILLNGFPESRGAMKELQWSIDLGHPVFYYYEGHPYTLARLSREEDHG